MEYKSLIEHYIREIKAENVSARKCLERIPESVYKFKPHERSMEMDYPALLVADIPNRVAVMITDANIDFGTYRHFPLSDAATLLKHYDESIKKSIDALGHITEDQLKKDFTLKRDGQLLYSSPMPDSIGETINHWVHHRGQLTVYMRLNEIAVPPIYGPSADDKDFNK